MAIQDQAGQSVRLAEDQPHAVNFYVKSGSSARLYCTCNYEKDSIYPLVFMGGIVAGGVILLRRSHANSAIAAS
jgi:hypothetical protein